jgi:hypothetical protein
MSFPGASVQSSTLESPFLSQSESIDVGDTPTAADEQESAFSSAMYYGKSISIRLRNGNRQPNH